MCDHSHTHTHTKTILHGRHAAESLFMNIYLKKKENWMRLLLRLFSFAILYTCVSSCVFVCAWGGGGFYLIYCVKFLTDLHLVKFGYFCILICF